MKPEYVTQADAHGLKVPVMRSIMRGGVYAEGVVGVIPTVTYPSHTTLVTGVWPAQHGVYDNTVFDPLHEHPNTWYWDFSDTKVPTLYTVADAAGLKTANVGAMEILDGQIGAIRDAALKANPGTRIVIVSDHGFLRVDHRTNLNVLLANAGLIKLGPPKAADKTPSVLDWQAEAWPAGGSNAIVLQNPSDKALLDKVRTVLETAKADSANGIETILTHDQIVARGGFPTASFLVDYKDGYDPGNAVSGPVVQDAFSTGMHGYLPSRSAMRSSFFIEGQGIAQGRDLGIIDMRQIAPTLAGLLDVILPEAKQPSLQLY